MAMVLAVLGCAGVWLVTIYCEFAKDIMPDFSVYCGLKRVAKNVIKKPIKNLARARLGKK